MKKLIFKGCAPAIVTPFDEDGGIDFDTLGVNIDFQLENGAAAIVACGTTGESATLSDMEFEQIISFCVGRINGRAPLIAGTGRNDTRHCAELSVTAKRLGADALLVVTPYYNKTTQAGLVAHFTAVADAAQMPVLLYNVPSRTGLSFTAETYARLAQNQYIYGVKEASGDMSLALETRALCPQDFVIYSGNDDTVLPILALGGAGVISTVSNIIPQKLAQMCQCWFDSDFARALELQIECQPLISAVFCEVNPIPLKAALALLGRDSGALRLPLVPIGEQNRARVEAALRAFGLLNA